MRRAAIVLTLILALPLLQPAEVLANGGGAGAPPPGATVVGPDVEYSIFLDPHNTGVTPTAGTIFSIKLKVGSTGWQSIATNLQINPSWNLGQGCEESLSFTRFGYTTAKPTTLYDWIDLHRVLFPNDVVTQLFAALGIPVEPVIAAPVIATMATNVCVGGQAPILIGISQPGFLLMEGVICFQVVGTTGRPPCP